MEQAAAGLVHDALIYASEEEFRRVATLYVEDALDAREPVLVVASTDRIALLEGAFGRRAAQIVFADASSWYGDPAETAASYRRYIERRLADGAQRVCILGELVWPADSPDAVRAWQRYESEINAAFDGQPLWVMCAYDRRALPEHVLTGARRTHPVVWENGLPQDSEQYLDPEAFASQLESEPA